MERQKAEFGKQYWCISLSAEGIRCETRWEEDDIWDRLRFSNNNYFHSQEEAESMASKLRAVLNGADVIEMPSEDEIEHDFIFAHISPIVNKELRGLIEATIRDTMNWLKSKTVK